MENQINDSETGINSHYDHRRGPRVYVSSDAFADLCGIDDPEDAKRGMLVYPYMIVNILTIIDEAIERAIDNGDIDRERALHCLYSQIVTASEDAGFNQPIALRHLNDLKVPVDSERELPFRYSPEPPDVDPDYAERTRQALRAIRDSVARNDRSRTEEIIRQIVDQLPKRFFD